MRKPMKRTLAVLLVVCVMLSLVAVPAAAIAEPSAESPKTYTYDFTILSNLAEAGDYTSEAATKVRWYNGELYYGYGNLNLMNLTSGQEGPLNEWYETGVHTRLVGEVRYTTELDLNWRVLTTKGEYASAYTTKTEYVNQVLQGGCYYNNCEKNKTHKYNYDGIWYEPAQFESTTDESTGTTTTTKVYTTGDWIAIKIKAPEVGNYTVRMTPVLHSGGAQQASVYVLPGVVEDKAVIEAAIANGTGKLENTVNFYKNTGTHEVGAVTELGAYTVSDPVDECTVIVKSDLNKNGNTVTGANNPARIHFNNIVFTQQAETEVVSDAKAKSYSFILNSSGHNFTAEVKVLTDTGTATAETGGYAVIDGNKRGLTIDDSGLSETVTATTINTNYIYLRYYNKASIIYYAKYTIGETTATVDSLNEGITNYNAKRAMDAHYDDWGWKLLGSSVADENYFYANDYLRVYNTTTEDHFLALQLQSPGSGAYEVDLGVRNPDGGSSALGRHMGLNVYIVEKDEAVCSADADLYVTATLPAAPDAYFNPNYTGTGDNKANVTAELLDYETGEPFVYNFEADKEYVVYLQARLTDKDGNTVNYFTATTTDNGSYKSTKEIGLVSIDCEPVEAAAATVGETKYSTLTAALTAAQTAAAESGETVTVKLQQDVLLSGVVIPDGVTLDLNGYTLTTAAVGPTGTLMGEGVVKTYADTPINAAVMAEKTLPLYDASVDGYKLFQYTYTNAQTEEVGNDTVKFWYQLQFTDTAAYNLIETGTSGMKMGAVLTADSNTTDCIFASSKQTDEEIVNDAVAWAAAYATFAKATLEKGKTPWLYVNVTSASMAETISVAPTITAGNADYTLDAINYDAN